MKMHKDEEGCVVYIQEKSATLWGKERPKDQMHPTEVGVDFFLDVWAGKQKTLHFGKWGTSLNMFNFNASKAAGLDILRCQEMMILY